MGFFNTVFKSLGFESETEKEQEKKQESINEDKYNKFNLHKNEEVNNMQNNGIMPNSVNLNNLVVYAPKNHGEVQSLVNCLMKNEACIVNLSGILQKDQDRILDFLSGAIYALQGTIKRLQGDLFILAPKGVTVKSI